MTHYSKQDLIAASEAGILAKDQVQKFENFVQKTKSSDDGEPLRLISGFSDIFVALACILTVGSATILATQINNSATHLVPPM